MDPERERIQEDLRGLVRGEVRCDDVFVQLYSTDASIYQVRPLGVVRPRTAHDVAACLRYAAERQIPIHARGAGTGLAGESLGPGLVLDFSCHFRRILARHAERVRVQPGVVHERLNAFLERSGRTFGPDPAMSHVTTLGSVAAIDGAGSRWLKYGSARRHVLAMQIVLADGKVMEVGREPLVGGHSVDADPRKRDLINRLVDVLGRNAQMIERHQPRSRVNRSGYQLAGVLSEDALDLPRLLVGSEGTLALFTELELATQPLPRHRGLTLLFFERLESAARAVEEILTFSPTACDLMDRRHLTLARETDDRFAQLIPPPAEAMLLVEHDGEDGAGVREQMRALVDRIRRRRRLAFDARQTSSPDEMELYWQLPRRVVPTLYRLKGSTRAVPFVEDIAVPPETLPKFLPEMQNILKQHQVTAALFGHAGHGQLHIRPFLDLSDPQHVAVLQQLANDLYEAVFRFGGTISGEHADGLSRTPFVRRQYGPLYHVFREVKRIFDPLNLLNPGKIVGDDPELHLRHLRPSELAATAISPPSASTEGARLPASAGPATGTLAGRAAAAGMLGTTEGGQMPASGSLAGAAVTTAAVTTAAVTTAAVTAGAGASAAGNSAADTRATGSSAAASQAGGSGATSQQEAGPRLALQAADASPPREAATATANAPPGGVQASPSAATEGRGGVRTSAGASPGQVGTAVGPSSASRFLAQLELAWQPGELVQQVRSCNACGHCRTQAADTRMCPVFRFAPAEEASPRAKANLMRAILTGQLPPEAMGEETFKEVADLCVNCHMCRLECPANVDIPKLMLEAKAAYVANNGLRPSDWVLTRLDLFSALGSRLHPLLNWMLSNRQARWLLEKLAGVARGRKLPRFAPRSFIRQAHRRRLTRPTRRAGRKILYFVDTYANYHDPQLAEALVAVMEHNGVAVYVPPEQTQSGMALVSVGAVDGARAVARRNVRTMAEAIRQGYAIVATEPSAALCIQRIYPDLLDDEDARLVAEHTSEACTYLWQLHLNGKLQLDLRPINAPVGYHHPCHLRALEVGSPGESLLRLIPGLTVQRIDKGCSGMAGTFGMKRENYRNSLRAGWPLIAAVRESTWQAGTTECSACKMQMEQGTTRPTIHPLKLLALSYGLLPSAAALLTARSKELTVT
ncbi:MAG: anaerobic glycerol-3-phosphate dehydrogenase subunit C [Pirellulales bacterium]|nr:anaerobic glycerol-3-phosphate dehydrogenase subunit C [Pirellulales bacterium]